MRLRTRRKAARRRVDLGRSATQRMLVVGLEQFVVCSKLECFATRSVLLVSPTHVPTFAVAFVGLSGPSVDNSGHQRFRPSLFLSRS